MIKFLILVLISIGNPPYNRALSTEQPIVYMFVCLFGGQLVRSHVFDCSRPEGPRDSRVSETTSKELVSIEIMRYYMYLMYFKTFKKYFHRGCVIFVLLKQSES